jgi:hypothetical protein
VFVKSLWVPKWALQGVVTLVAEPHLYQTFNHWRTPTIVHDDSLWPA